MFGASRSDPTMVSGALDKLLFAQDFKELGHGTHEIEKKYLNKLNIKLAKNKTVLARMDISAIHFSFI